MFRKKKRSVVSDEERLLEYLLTLDRDEENRMSFGINHYKQVPGFTPEQVAQTLVALDDARLIEANFCGQKTHKTLCRIKLLEAGLAYFEDQDSDEENRQSDRFHDYKVAAVGAVIGIIGTKLLEIIF